MGARRLCGIAVAAVLLLAPSGCGDGGATRFSGGDLTDAGGGGTLEFAIAADPGDLDPLDATRPSQRYAAAQVFEPLVSELQGPYGLGRARGLALGWGASGDFRIWSFRLRAGVDFQDGTPLDASAVAVNGERWRTDAVGQALLPGLIATDAPNPRQVRFILSTPDRDFPARLADSRLGIVSPPALLPQTGTGATLLRPNGAGTGPFELRARGPSRLALARNRHWWGSSEGLGPALDDIDFVYVPLGSRRLDALRDGRVRVAAELPPEAGRSVQGDPLLSAVGVGSDSVLGFERSVRGIDTNLPQPLNDVWLALLEAG